jgi:hypothetical protein
VSRDHRRVDLPGWSGAAKRRALNRAAERAFPETGHVSTLAAGDSVAGETGNPFYDLLWVLVDGSGVAVEIDPKHAEYGSVVVDTDPTARLLGGLPAGSLGGDHDRVPGFEVQYDLSRDRAAELVEAALFVLADPRDAVLRFVAESQGLDLGSLHAYGRGIANDSQVDGTDRTGPRRFGRRWREAAPVASRQSPCSGRRRRRRDLTLCQPSLYSRTARKRR